MIGHFDNAFFVRLGTATGQFGAPALYALRNHGRRIAIADVNRDGYDDVIGVHDGSGQPVYVSVYLGSATGAMQKVWEAGTIYSTSRDIAVGDFDGDGLIDFVVATGDDRAGLLVFRGLGSGEFGAAEPLPPLPSPTPGASDGTAAVATGDVNGDGLDDLVVAHNTFVDGVAIRISTGTGFGAPTILSGAAPLDVALADVDGDDKIDAVLSDFEDGTIAVRSGTETGGFGAPRRFRVGPAPVSLALADLDGDGRLDVAVTDIEDHRVRVLMNR